MSAAESLRELIGDIVRQLFPAAAVPWGPYEYRVESVGGDGRLTLVAVKPGGPAKERVDVWGGIPGSAGSPQVGSSVALVFLDGEHPAVVSFHPLRLTGGTPTKARIDADEIDLGGAVGPVVRVGEAVVVDPTTGVLTRKPALSQPAGFESPSKVKA